MTTGPAAVEGSATAALANWANGCDGWVRAIASEVLLRRGPLTEDEIDAAFHELLREKGLEEGEATTVPQIAITAAAPANAAPLQMTRLGDTSNVNRLVGGQEIRFNERLTVVYGENASGKTGYSRVLKQAAGARSAVRVLPDIYTSSGGEPAATIEYLIGSAPKTVAWHDGAEAVPDLRRACVFDAPAAPLHVDEDLTYLHTPPEIALFEYVNGALKAVREMLSAERGRLAPRGNPFVSRFRRGTPQYALVEAIRASTDLGELHRLAESVDDEDGDEAAKLASLGDRVRTLDGGEHQVQLAGARATQAMCASFVAIADRLLGFDAAQYGQAVDAVVTRQIRVRDVSEALFAGQDLLGLFSDEWTAFVAAAHEYGVAHIGDGFPDNVASCPYCGQDLDDASRELLAKYKTYLLDDSQVSLQAAAQALDNLVSSVAGDP